MDQKVAGTYDLTFAREEVNPLVALCGLVQFVPIQGTAAEYNIYADYHVMVRSPAVLISL